jgi:hypothetical protein
MPSQCDGLNPSPSNTHAQRKGSCSSFFFPCSCRDTLKEKSDFSSSLCPSLEGFRFRTVFEIIQHFHVKLHLPCNVPFFFSFVVLRIKPKASHTLGRCCTTELCPSYAAFFNMLSMISTHDFHSSLDLEPDSTWKLNSYLCATFGFS